MGLHRGFSSLLPLLAVSASVAYAQQSSHKFVDSKASSTYGPQFEAIRATEAGAGYWSSAGHHSNDEEGTENPKERTNTPSQTLWGGSDVDRCLYITCLSEGATCKMGILARGEGSTILSLMATQNRRAFRKCKSVCLLMERTGILPCRTRERQARTVC